MKSISRKSDITKSIISDDIRWIWRYAKSSILITTFVIGILLFFLNILIWISNQANLFWNKLQEKLSIYLEIDKNNLNNDDIYPQILKLQKNLDSFGIKNKFVSEKDWLKQLSKTMPEIIKTLNQYNIDSPFTDILYVYIKSENQYLEFSKIIPNYKDIIKNFDNISNNKDFLDQESRIIDAIKFINFIIWWAYFLFGVFFIIIIANIFYLVRILIAKFIQQIWLKKLLGASYSQISTPFFVMIAGIIFLWWIIMSILMLLLDFYLKKYNFSLVFFVDIFSLDIIPESFSNIFYKARIVIPFQIIFLISISIIINWNYLFRVIKKSWD